MVALQRPLNNSGWLPSRGRSFGFARGSYRTSGSTAGSWMLRRLLNVPSGGECWVWSRHLLCSRACRWTPRFGLQLLMSMVSPGREKSPCLAPRMLEGRRERDLLFKRSCFFSHPYSLFINLTQFHNSQTCKAAGLFLFCLNLSEPAKFLRLARGAASTMAFQGLLGLEVCRCFLLDLTLNEQK